MSRETTGRQAQVDDLDGLVLGRETVGLLVGLKEAATERIQRIFPPDLVGHRHQQLVVLSLVAEVEPAGKPAALGGDPLPLEPVGRLGFQLAKPLLQNLEGLGPEPGHPRSHQVSSQVLDQETHGAEDARPGGNDDLRDAELAGQGSRVQRPGPTERQQDKQGRIHAPLDRDEPECSGHVGVNDPHDAPGGLERRKSEPPTQLGDGRPRFVQIQRHPTSQQPLRGEPSQEQVRVGDGGRGPPPPVAGRARIRARALGPDHQGATGIDPGNAAAPGSDGMDVERRNPDRDSADLALEGERRNPVPHQ
ncbi:MAG: hypothetical protein AAB285_06355 [candidate division NC10 bacterium]